MLTKEQCQAAINARLEALVGQGVSVEVSDFEGFECDVLVKIKHDFSIGTREKISANKAAGTLLNFADYKKAVSDTLAEESKNAEHLENFHKHIESCAYAAAKEALYELPQAFATSSPARNARGAM